MWAYGAVSESIPKRREDALKINAVRQLSGTLAEQTELLAGEPRIVRYSQDPWLSASRGDALGLLARGKQFAPC